MKANFRMKKPKKMNREYPEWGNLIDWLVYSIYLYAIEYGEADERVARCIMEADYRFYMQDLKDFNKAFTEAVAICRNNELII
ncbi:MAG: hypothetical protein ABSE16_00350 [Verrucomicrobiota bacterium]|jgi:hypothetical protein